MSANEAVIAVGSNIDPESNIQKATQEIRRSHDLVRSSRMVQTKPRVFRDQPDFLNGALLVRTQMTVTDLKAWLRRLEARLGRVRTGNKHGPRTIDLDIVVWNGVPIDPDIHSRDFLREAVHEVLPQFDL